MFITPAFAQAAGASPQDTLTTFVLPMALIFVVFYFFMIRPQQQKTKQLKAMLEALRRGDRVVTAGGIIGTVAKVDGDQEVVVEIAENVRVKVVRSTITTVLAKPEPVAARKKDEADSDKKNEAKTPEPIGGRAHGRRGQAQELAEALSRRAARGAMLYFQTWKVTLILAVCALGVIFTLPNLFSPAAVELAELAPEEAGGSRPRSARRLLSALLGRHELGRRRTSSTTSSTSCALSWSAAQDRLYRARRRRRPCRLGAARSRQRRCRARHRGEDRSGPGGDGAAPAARSPSAPAPRRSPRARHRRCRPVDRDRAAPHRRDRHQGSHHPARRRRPHPRRAAGDRRSRARQVAHRQDREDDLPARRRERLGRGCRARAGAARRCAAEGRGRSA